MIRLATAADLPAVAAIYDAILDREAKAGVSYTNWQKGKYPTLDTAKGILEAGTLYVGADEDGTVWGSMNLNGCQLPEYAKIDWSIPAAGRTPPRPGAAGPAGSVRRIRTGR